MCCRIVFGSCLCVCLFALCSVSTSSFQHSHFFLLWECRHYNSDFFHYSSELDFVLYARYTLYFRRALFNLNWLYMLSIGSCVRVLAKFTLFPIEFILLPWLMSFASKNITPYCIKLYCHSCVFVRFQLCRFYQPDDLRPSRVLGDIDRDARRALP